MKIRRVYLVRGSIGSYDDIWDWPVVAFDSAAKAMHRKSELQIQADEIQKAVEAKTDDDWPPDKNNLPPSDDPEFPYCRLSSWDRVEYYIEEFIMERT